MHERNGASIRNIAEVLWETPPEHYDAHSKMLVNPKTAQTQRFDHRDIVIPAQGLCRAASPPGAGADLPCWTARA